MVAEKPDDRSYPPVQTLELACYDVALATEDVRDSITLVGGLAPSLLIDQSRLPVESRHVGTVDVDLVVQVGLDGVEDFDAVRDALLVAGFIQRGSSLRWTRAREGEPTAILDVILSSDVGEHRAWLPEVALAVRHRKLVEIQGRTAGGSIARRQLWVANAGAFLNLKSIAFRRRRTPKDAYDMMHVIRHYLGPLDQEIALCTREPHGTALLELLDDEFVHEDDPGPISVARFLTGGADDAVQAEVVSLAHRILTVHGR